MSTSTKEVARSRRFFFGHLRGGNLFYDLEYGEYKTLAEALKRSLNVPQTSTGGRVIVESVDVTRLGHVYGRRTKLRSVRDGELLKGWS